VIDVSFRELQRDDLPLLFGWLREPHVAEWWRDVPADLDAVEAEYGPCIDGDDPTELHVVEVDGWSVGMIQRYLITDEPDWRPAFDGICDVTNAAGIDYLIGDPRQIGKGIGTAAVAAYVSRVFGWRPVDSIVVTVDQANVGSWRILEKSGFARIYAGEINSPDPSDSGPQYAYRINR
jgi:aminoglycoside 6'-N-acetyltransferase